MSLWRCCRGWARLLRSTRPSGCGTRCAHNPFLTAQGLSLSLAGSFGLATFPEDGNSVQAIIRAADTMMYAAKTTRDNISVAGMGLVVGEKARGPIPVHRAATMAGADLELMRR